METKSVFIDAGAHLGRAFLNFRKRSRFSLDKCDYILIEPNKECIKDLESVANGREGITILNKALFIQDSVERLYGENHHSLTNPSEGLSLIQHHNTMYWPASALTSVESIDVTRFLVELSQKYENIYLKLDIEAAEYDVLEKIIQDGCHKHIKEMWVEWHDKYMLPELRKSYVDRQDQIMAFFSAQKIPIRDWN